MNFIDNRMHGTMIKKNGISFFSLSSLVFFWDGTLASNQISPHTVADL